MSKMNVVLVATLLASASSAWADGKYKRQQDVKVNVTLSDRVKPIQTQPKSVSEFKPELNADQVLSIEGLVSNIRNEQEQILAQLIDQTPDSEVEEKSDYYFRLGELYAKQQRLYRLKSAEAAIAVDKAKTPQQKAQAQANANKAADMAKQYLLKAVKTYKGLTDNDAFRNYPKMDMALFYYGYTLQGGHYMKEARAVYDKLLKNYPNSKYVPEAHLAFADYFFEQGQLDDAEARYKQVLKFPKSTAYWYAMYKMGWIHINKQRFQEALETFFQVASATKNDKKNEVLNRASKKDFVRAYAEVGKADKAYDAEDFVNELRKVTPHVAQNTSGRSSAIDGRTTRHSGYAVSQRIRKRIEEAFGWIKTVAGQERTKFRGRERVGWAFVFAAAAYNLARLPKLLEAPA